jgi:hypothetical protein
MAKTRSVSGGAAKASSSSSHKISSNWEGSNITIDDLRALARIGLLPKDEDGIWRAPREEETPTPRDNELVFFVAHIERGLSVEGSRFFYELLVFYGLRLHDIGPNSILQVSAFTFLCEAFLQVAPTMGL